MKKINYLFLFTILFATQVVVLAQVEPVMYFCERYDDYDGEVGVGDRFKKGSITIMIRSDMALKLSHAIIRYDKFNHNSNQFEYYKKSIFDTEREMNYLKFIMDKENDMEFEHQGFYRVFLLDEDEQMITSALIEIID